MILYVVSLEGYYDGYGSQNYIIGVFNDEAKAKEQIVKTATDIKKKFPALENNVEDIMDKYIYITRLYLNHVYSIPSTMKKTTGEILKAKLEDDGR